MQARVGELEPTMNRRNPEQLMLCSSISQVNIAEPDVEHALEIYNTSFVMSGNLCGRSASRTLRTKWPGSYQGSKLVIVCCCSVSVLHSSPPPENRNYMYTSLAQHIYMKQM